MLIVISLGQIVYLNEKKTCDLPDSYSLRNCCVNSGRVSYSLFDSIFGVSVLNILCVVIDYTYKN